ncbi:MAG: hypothetical protein QG670_910 [Thermoproteota archaeon]|nr:hypothetical protein [Thermoproteota archaeon]
MVCILRSYVMLSKKLLVICGAYAVDPLVMQSFNPLVPSIKTAFSVDITLVALSTAFHMLPLSVLCLFSGTISDLYSRPKILMYGLFIYSFGLMLGSISPNITIFLLTRIIDGVGAALIQPICVALIGDITPEHEVGKAIGFSGMFLAFVGMTLGPLISGFLGEINWRIVPLYICVYSLIIGVFSMIVFRGFITPVENTRNVSVVFQKIRSAVGNRNLLLLAPVGFISMFAWSAVQPLISDSLSLPPLLLKKSEIGTIFSIVGFVGVFFAYIGGVLTDKLGAKRSILFALLMEAIPLFLLIFANSYWSFSILLAINGAFNRVSQTSRSTLAVELTPEARGSASSVIQFAQFLGYSSSPIIIPLLYLSSGIDYVFLLSSSLMLLSIVFIASIHLNKLTPKARVKET